MYISVSTSNGQIACNNCFLLKSLLLVYQNKYTDNLCFLKFIYSEKATKFCEIFI